MKLKVSIGIPAYNEERRIREVLRGIFKQKQTNWELLEVIVVADGCSDRTVARAKSIIHPHLTVIDSRERLGKTARLNQLFSLFRGEVLIMFDGDIEFSNTEVVNQLLVPFIENKQVMLVGGNSMPKAPINFVQRAVYSTFEVFYASRKELRSGHNVFGATGSILAIRKKLAKAVKLPKIVSEDAYLYLDCLSKGYQFRYVDSAVIYYTLPTSFTDYLKQVMRSSPTSVETELEPYFGSQVYHEFDRPHSFYAQAVLKAFIKNPFGVSVIIVINVLSKPFQSLVMKNYKLDWFTAQSTH